MASSSVASPSSQLTITQALRRYGASDTLTRRAAAGPGALVVPTLILPPRTQGELETRTPRGAKAKRGAKREAKAGEGRKAREIPAVDVDVPDRPEPPRYPWEELLERERRKRLGLPGVDTPEESEEEEELPPEEDDETDASRHARSGLRGATASTADAEVEFGVERVKQLGMTHAERQALWYTRNRPKWHAMRGTVASDIRETLKADGRVQARLATPRVANPYVMDVLATPRYRPRVVAAEVEATGDLLSWGYVAHGTLTQRRHDAERERAAQARREKKKVESLATWRAQRDEVLADAMLTFEARRLVEARYAQDVTRYLNATASDRLHAYNRTREQQLAKARRLRAARRETGRGTMSGVDL